MKKISIVLVSLCALSGCAALTWLVGGKEELSSVRARLDTDKDGVLSKAEVVASGLDLDADGVLTQAELDSGRKEVPPSTTPDSLLSLLTYLVPGGGLLAAGLKATQIILAQRAHLRAVVGGVEDVKKLCMSRPAGSGSPLSADNWDEIKTKLVEAAKAHTNPEKLNALVQKITEAK